MAAPLILLAAHMVRSSASILLSFVGSYVTKQFVESNKQELTDEGYRQLSEQFNSADKNDGALSNQYSPNGKYLTPETLTKINSIIAKKSRGDVLSDNDYSILTYYGYEWSITQNKPDSNISDNTNSGSSFNSSAAFLKEIDYLKNELNSAKNDISSLMTALGAMNEYYASQDSLNNAISDLQNQISSSTTSNPGVGGLIGALSESTAKLDSISRNLVSLNTSTQNVASKTGSFSGKLEITNAKDMAQSVSVSANVPDIKVNPQLTAILDMAKPMSIDGFSDLVSAQIGLKSLEDTRVKREEEAHSILKEKTDFLTRPRTIRDMDGNEIANVAPREMALTHQASLARTYTDENTLTAEDIDFGNFDLDIPDFFNTLKPGLATDIILNSDIKNT